MEYDYVKKNIMSSCRIPEDELTLVKGLFSDSLPKFDPDKAAHTTFEASV